MSTPYEWRINDIEHAANNANSRLHELDSLRSNVDSLERSLREASAEINGLRNELETTRQKLENLEWQVADILSSINDPKR